MRWGDLPAAVGLDGGEAIAAKAAREAAAKFGNRIVIDMSGLSYYFAERALELPDVVPNARGDGAAGDVRFGVDPVALRRHVARWLDWLTGVGLEIVAIVRDGVRLDTLKSAEREERRQSKFKQWLATWSFDAATTSRQVVECASACVESAVAERRMQLVEVSGEADRATAMRCIATADGGALVLGNDSDYLVYAGTRGVILMDELVVTETCVTAFVYTQRKVYSLFADLSAATSGGTSGSIAGSGGAGGADGAGKGVASRSAAGIPRSWSDRDRQLRFIAALLGNDYTKCHALDQLHVRLCGVRVVDVVGENADFSVPGERGRSKTLSAPLYFYHVALFVLQRTASNDVIEAVKRVLHEAKLSPASIADLVAAIIGAEAEYNLEAPLAADDAAPTIDAVSGPVPAYLSPLASDDDFLALDRAEAFTKPELVLSDASHTGDCGARPVVRQQFMHAWQSCVGISAAFAHDITVDNASRPGPTAALAARRLAARRDAATLLVDPTSGSVETDPAKLLGVAEGAAGGVPHKVLELRSAVRRAAHGGDSQWSLQAGDLVDTILGPGVVAATDVRDPTGANPDPGFSVTLSTAPRGSEAEWLPAGHVRTSLVVTDADMSHCRGDEELSRRLTPLPVGNLRVPVRPCPTCDAGGAGEAREERLPGLHALHDGRCATRRRNLLYGMLGCCNEEGAAAVEALEPWLWGPVLALRLWLFSRGEAHPVPTTTLKLVSALILAMRTGCDKSEGLEWWRGGDVADNDLLVVGAATEAAVAEFKKSTRASVAAARSRKAPGAPGVRSGGAPRPPSGGPRKLGGAPRTLGGAPRTLGGAPRTLGGAPRTLGGVPRTLGGASGKLGGAPRTLGAPGGAGGAGSAAARVAASVRQPFIHENTVLRASAHAMAEWSLAQTLVQQASHHLTLDPSRGPEPGNACSALSPLPPAGLYVHDAMFTRWASARAPVDAAVAELALRVISVAPARRPFTTEAATEAAGVPDARAAVERLVAAAAAGGLSGCVSDALPFAPPARPVGLGKDEVEVFMRVPTWCSEGDAKAALETAVAAARDAERITASVARVDPMRPPDAYNAGIHRHCGLARAVLSGPGAAACADWLAAHVDNCPQVSGLTMYGGEEQSVAENMLVTRQPPSVLGSPPPAWVNLLAPTRFLLIGVSDTVDDGRRLHARHALHTWLDRVGARAEAICMCTNSNCALVRFGSSQGAKRVAMLSGRSAPFALGFKASMVTRRQGEDAGVDGRRAGLVPKPFGSSSNNVMAVFACEHLAHDAFGGDKGDGSNPTFKFGYRHQFDKSEPAQLESAKGNTASVCPEPGCRRIVCRSCKFKHNTSFHKR